MGNAEVCVQFTVLY